MSIDVENLHHRRAIRRWERVSVGDVLERVTWSYPDKEAIVGWDGAYAYPEHGRLSYRAADELANRFANALRERGLSQGDRVLLFCENSVEAYLAKVGIAKAGLVCAPVNPMMAPDVVAYLISLVEPRLSVVDAELWPRARPAFEVAGLRPDVTIPIGGEAVAGSVSFADFVRGRQATEPDVQIHADDIWEILFTSGTTAMPKGVMLSHNYSYMSAYSFALSLTRGVHLECDLKLCSFLPVIYHVADQIFTLPAFLAGGTLVIGRRPLPDSIAEAVTREGVTALWAGSPQFVNAFTDRLLRDRFAYDPRSLRVVVYGWSALSPGTAASLKQLCGDELVLLEIFGQTEAISCHRFWPDKWPETYRRSAPAVNYVGVPNPLLAAVAMDDGGRMLRGSPGVAGEMVYRSPAVTAGYYRDEAATRAAFRSDWFHSGDSCVYDEDGLAIMVDRYKDLVKSGGESVSTLRVEAILLQHPAVQRAAVVGLPHERWGEAVTAIVVLRAGQDVTREELIAHCREKLAGFETPKSVVFVDDLPETVGGKVLKYRLRETFADLYRDAAAREPQPSAEAADS